MEESKIYRFANGLRPFLPDYGSPIYIQEKQKGIFSLFEILLIDSSKDKSFTSPNWLGANYFPPFFPALDFSLFPNIVRPSILRLCQSTFTGFILHTIPTLNDPGKGDF